MIKLTINNTPVEVEPGTLILDAAEKLGFSIPTLCYLPGHDHISSCMVCAVKECKSGIITPACTAKVAEGMEIDTESDDVREMRKNSLELLLSEHVGDCEAPCRITCPASMNVPLMLRHIQNNDLDKALSTAREHLAMPAVLGYVCEAPCEKACHRGRQDATVQIKTSHRWLAEQDFNKKTPAKAVPSSGKKIAIIGAGMAGLSAAYFLNQKGHAVTLFEKKVNAGGYLRMVDELPQDILDKEIKWILSHGVDLQTSTAVNATTLESFSSTYDAVIVANGCGDFADYVKKTPNYFAVGYAAWEGCKYIWATADANEVSEVVHNYLMNGEKTLEPKPFNSRMGALKEGELEEFMKFASDIPQVDLTEADDICDKDMQAEAERCMHCDCSKPDNCKLRIYSQEYGADQKAFGRGKREPINITLSHEVISFEPAKCIKCGICIQLCEDAGEQLGISFNKRGYKLTVDVPFGETINSGLSNDTAIKCAELCPTAALSLKDHPTSTKSMVNNDYEVFLLHD